MDLKTYRETVKQTTPTKAARELGVSYVSYWRWESGHTTPRDSAMRKIMAWSDDQVTPNDFMPGGDDA